MADLDAGKLNKRIVIQKTIEEHDSDGGLTESWEDVKKCWAEIKPLGGKQVFEYRSLNVKASHRIKVRANIEVEEYYRICYQRNRYFEVLTVEDEDEAGVVKWVICQEVRI